jgi:hypothetical protein
VCDVHVGVCNFCGYNILSGIIACIINCYSDTMLCYFDLLVRRKNSRNVHVELLSHVLIDRFVGHVLKSLSTGYTAFVSRAQKSVLQAYHA